MNRCAVQRPTGARCRSPLSARERAHRGSLRQGRSLPPSKAKGLNSQPVNRDKVFDVACEQLQPVLEGRGTNKCVTLQQFELTARRNREAAQLIQSARGLRVAAQVPNQHIGIDQHRQSALREPSRP